MTERQWKHYYFQCFSYVVNLVAQAFFLGKTADITLEKLELAYSWQDFKIIAIIWKKQGVLGWLHNIVKYIRILPQHHKEFQKIVVGGEWAEFD